MNNFNSTWSNVDNYKLTTQGFAFAGISAGLKKSKKKDLALILAPKGSICSGFFTQSEVRASCIDICEQRINSNNGRIRAILVNSGQANACTGNLGIKDSIKATKELAKLLDISEDQILVCSTGVIGIPIPMSRLIKNLPLLVQKLNDNNFNDASEAILTTDLVSKKVVIQTFIEGRCIRIAAFAKGSGMIYPNMATMLAFLTCDVGIDQNDWAALVRDALQISFNAISVDGETSTNDSFIAINTGKKIDKKYLPLIKEGVILACQNLAKSIARDGEGANCLLEVIVDGTKNNIAAMKIAKSIINSSLVKTAIHGCDPNWGRIISAAGNSGVVFDTKEIDLYIGKYEILNQGILMNFSPKEVTQYMRSKMAGKYLIDDKIQIILKFKSGKGIAKAWGCDLSQKYVQINSEYTT